MQASNGLLKKKVNGLRALCDKNKKQPKSKDLFDELRDAGEGNFLFLSPAKVQQAVRGFRPSYLFRPSPVVA